MANINSLNRMIAAVNKGLARPADLPLLRQHALKIVQSSKAKDMISAVGQLTDAIIARQLLFKSSLVVALTGQRTPILLKKESVTFFAGTDQPNIGELAEPVEIYGAHFTDGTRLSFGREGNPTHARETSGREIYIGELRLLGRMSGADFPQTQFFVEDQKMYFYPGTELTMTANKFFISAKIAVDHRLLNQDFRSGTVITYEPENHRFKVTVAWEHQFPVNGKLVTFKPGDTLIINNKGEIVPDEAQVALDATRSSLLGLLNARPTGAPAAEKEIASLRQELAKANRKLHILDAALAKPAYTVSEMIEQIKAQVTKLQEQWLAIDAIVNAAEEARAQLEVKLMGNEEANTMLSARLTQRLSELEARIVKTKEEHEQRLAEDPMVSACQRENAELTQLWAQTIDPKQKKPSANKN